MTLLIYDPEKKELTEEKIFGKRALTLLYQNNRVGKLVRRLSLGWVAKWPLTSYLYGRLQKTKRSKRKVDAFVKKFGLKVEEFEKQVHEFNSFNDFFIRKLKAATRPIDPDLQTLVMPADGRYLAFETFEKTDSLFVKGQTFSLPELIGKKELPWQGESTVFIIRLCPTDYHRFHFPISGKASAANLIRGSLFSVSPMALKLNTRYLTENKRMVTTIDTENFGKLLMIEIGATHVGSIRQTYDEKMQVVKGQEKGFFEFGGSCIVLALEKKNYQIDPLMLQYSLQGVETLGYFGRSLLKLL